MRGWRGRLAGSLALAVAVTGCTLGGGEGASDASDGGESEQLTAYEKEIRRARDPGAVSPAQPVSGAVNGGTITVLSSRPGPTSLRGAGGGHARALRSLVTRGLTQYQRREDEIVLVPDLAEGLGTANEDDTRWEFTLRDGVTWEDGDPITSGEVARGFRAALDSPAGRRYFGGAGTGDGSEGDGSGEEGSAEDGDSAGGSDGSDGPTPAVRTPDERTVVIHTEQPFPDLPHFVASPNLAPLPGDDEDATLASGPYTVARMSAEAAVLLRNDAWDPDTDPVRRQYPDKWSFDFNRDAEEIQQRVLDGSENGKTTIVPDEIDPEVAQQAGERALEGAGRCVEVGYPSQDTLAEKERRALVAATPRETGSLLPTWVPGRRDAQPEPKGDAVRSKKLLESADALGTSLTLYAVDDEDGRAAREKARTAYERAGFEVEFETVTRSDLEDIADGSAEPAEDISLVPGQVCTVWPSGGGLFPLLADEEPLPSAVPGWSKRVDDIERKGTNAALAAWGALDRDLRTKQGAVVPIREVPNTALHGSRIAHLRMDPVTGEPDYRSVYLDE